RQLLGEVLAPFVPLASGKGLNLTHHVAADLPDGWLGDAVRLRQLLRHLVGNAIKFTHHGEVVVSVRHDKETRWKGDKWAKEQPPCCVSLSCDVCDTGIGIPPERQESIFAPFEQADTSSTRGHCGVGLGLSIATRLVGLMGGQISVDSTPGQGSTFHVRVALE